jgi:hypothetical protein
LAIKSTAAFVGSFHPSNAGGASVVNVGGQGAPKSDEGDLFANLEKAKKLFDSGVISDAEYQELKAKIISKAA